MAPRAPSQTAQYFALREEDFRTAVIDFLVTREGGWGQWSDLSLWVRRRPRIPRSQFHLFSVRSTSEILRKRDGTFGLRFVTLSARGRREGGVGSGGKG